MPTRSRPRISAEPRAAAHRKSELRSLRRSGKTPGSLYGHGDPETIQVPSRTLREFLHHHAVGALLELELEGRMHTALLREVDREPVHGEIIHVGLQRVDMRENIRATIPLIFNGEENLISERLVLTLQLHELEVYGRADLLPEQLVVDLDGLDAGTILRIQDLALPAGLQPTRPGDTTVATISLPSVPADVAAVLDQEMAEQAALHVEERAEQAEADREEVEEKEVGGRV